MLQYLFRIAPFIGVILATLGIFEWLNRISIKANGVFWATAILTGLVLLLILRQATTVTLHHRIRWPLFFLASVAVVVPFLPAILASRLMITGEYPAAFFNVDSPYHLSQVFSLLRGNDYPPESLNNKGIYFNYHYGVQLSAAAISRNLGFPPHVAYFGIVPAVFLLSAIFCIYFVMTGLRTWLARCAVSLILLYHYYYILNEWDGGAYIFDIESFGGGFPHISSLAAICFALFIIYVYETWHDCEWKFAAILISPTVVVLFKSPFVFAFLAFVLGYLILVSLKRRFTTSRVLWVLLSALIFLFAASQVGNGNAAFRFVGILGKKNLQWTEIFKLALFIFTPLALLAQRATTEALLKIVPYLLAACLPALFFYFFSLEINGTPDNNIRQILLTAPVWLCITFVTLLDSSKAKTLPRGLAAFFFVSVGGLPVVINRVVNAEIAYRDPASWHEFVANERLGSCLYAVPVENSLLVTNDLRYPANNFGRPMMQMQIPGLFGHQMFAGNALWEKYYVDKHRFALQDALITGNVDLIEAYAKANGWTHGLLFKRKDYAKGNWPIVCENDELAIVKY